MRPVGIMLPGQMKPVGMYVTGTDEAPGIRYYAYPDRPVNYGP